MKYQAECDRLMQKDAVRKIIKGNPELDSTFLGFLDDYSDLEGKLPLDMTVIDLGCHAGIQADYFSDMRYIGVDSIPVEGRYEGENITHISTSI